MEKYQRKIITTKDGSHSLFIPEIDETYHSTKGAEKESQYIYIDHGLLLVAESEEPIEVLEIGMGTGLNALLSFEFSLNNAQAIQYTTVEPYPISRDQIRELNYTEEREDSSTDFFDQIHDIGFGVKHTTGDHFEFEKFNMTLEEYSPPKGHFDVVFYDAFAPSKQAEIWAKPLLQKVYDAMKEGALLTTYCAQGQFKRDLRDIGFRVENPEGPMGKKEMTIAWKPESAIC